MLLAWRPIRIADRRDFANDIGVLARLPKRRTLTKGTENPFARRHIFLLNKPKTHAGFDSLIDGNIRDGLINENRVSRRRFGGVGLNS